MAKKSLNIFKGVTKLFNAAKSRTMSDEQLEAAIKDKALNCCGDKALDLSVKIEPITYHQKGNAHKGKAVVIELAEHCDDYPFVQKLGDDLRKELMLPSSYSLRVSNAMPEWQKNPKPAEQQKKEVAPAV